MKSKIVFNVLPCVLALVMVAAATAAAQKTAKAKPADKSEAAEPEAEETGEGDLEAAEADEPLDAPAPAETAEAAEVKHTPEPVFSKEEYSIDKILKTLKAIKERLELSEKRMDEIVGVVLSSADTKGSRIKLIHQSDMSPDFKLVQIIFSLDGAPIYKKSDDDGLTMDKEVEIYDGAILPGDHKLSVTLIYRGHGYGIMSYLSKYKFKVRSSHSFSVKQGKGIQLKVISFEKGDVNTKLEDRPAVKYSEKKIEME
jgi:hypothetical protein